MPSTSSERTAGMVCYFDADTYPGVYNASNLLVERGWHVDVVCFDQYGFKGERFDPRVRIHRIRPGMRSGPLGGLRFYQEFVRNVRKVSQANRWNWAFGHDLCGFTACRLARVLPARRVVFWSQDLAEPRRLTFDKRCLYHLKRHLLRTCPLAIATSTSRAAVMRGTLPLSRAPVVVYNSPRRDLPTFERGIWRSRLAIDDKHILGVYAGGIGRNRFVPELVQSVRDWPRDASLVIAGYGSPEVIDEIRAAASTAPLQGRVHLLEHLPHPFELLNDSDFGVSLFALDPNHRNLAHRGIASNKIFENLAFGNPVVATGNAETSDFFRRWGCGVCVENHTPAGIAAAVRSLLEDRASLKQRSDAARHTHLHETYFEKRFHVILEVLETGDLEQQCRPPLSTATTESSST